MRAVGMKKTLVYYRGRAPMELEQVNMALDCPSPPPPPFWQGCNNRIHIASIGSRGFPSSWTRRHERDPTTFHAQKAQATHRTDILQEISFSSSCIPSIDTIWSSFPRHMGWKLTAATDHDFHFHGMGKNVQHNIVE
ncbi:hypothetical protein NC651_037795 [Populus alba x Populus x berolinensis]|nr:hypothetical protein NC651_037795 [Populus alba x Populus x berolinensis]